MGNKYLIKIASKASVERKLSTIPEVMTSEEVDTAISKRGLNVEVLRLNRGSENIIERVKELLPENKGRLAKKVVETSERRGPLYFATEERPYPSKGLLLDGGINHTTPVLHELGHSIDLEGQNKFLTKLKIRSDHESGRISKSPLLGILAGAAATSPKYGAAAMLIPWIAKAPKLRSEIAANLNAAKIVEEEKGTEASRQYLKDVAPSFATYLKGPAAQTGAIGAIHLIAKRKEIPRLVKGMLMKKAMMEKHGDPKKKGHKPRSQMTPEELKILKYKAIMARKRREGDVKMKPTNKYLEKIAESVSPLSDSEIGVGEATSYRSSSDGVIPGAIVGTGVSLGSLGLLARKNVSPLAKSLIPSVAGLTASIIAGNMARKYSAPQRQSVIHAIPLMSEERVLELESSPETAQSISTISRQKILDYLQGENIDPGKGRFRNDYNYVFDESLDDRDSRIYGNS